MTDLAVVPIFVNAGAAVLPAIVGGLASAVALLFKPRELFALFRRRPLIPLLLVVLAGVARLGVSWLYAAAFEKPGMPAAPLPDWGDIGRHIVLDNQIRRATTAPAIAGLAGDTMLGGDASRCSFDGGPDPLGLTESWSFRDGATYFLSTPAIRDGRVFGATLQLDIAGKFGYIIAVDAANGKELWRKSAPTVDGEPFKAFFSSPAVTRDGKRLIIGQGQHEHADCSLLCFDTANGNLIWQAPTTLHLESSPAIHDDLVVIGAGAIEDSNHKPTGDPGYVIGVSISTGKEIWRYAVADAESSPAIADDGTVYIGSGFNGNAVVALRGESDEILKAKNLDRLLWKTPAPYPVTGAVTIAGDLIIVGGGNSDFVNAAPKPAGMLMALDRKTGQVRWQKDMGDSVLGFVSHRDGKLIVPVRNGDVAMLDAKTGDIVWRTKLAEETPVFAGCAFTGTHVYAVLSTGLLYVLDAKDGKPVAGERPQPLNDPARPGERNLSVSAPAIAGGRIYLGSETGGLRCFRGTKEGGSHGR